MRSFIEHNVICGLSPAGNRGRLSIFIFHRVLAREDEFFPLEIDTSEQFDGVLGWISAGFNVMPLSEALNRLKSGELPAAAAAITFDDGYADNHDIALPLLQARGMTATFFIATGFLDGGRMWNDTIIEAVRRTDKREYDASHLSKGILNLSTIDAKRLALRQLIPTIKHLSPENRSDEVERIATVLEADLPDDLMMTSGQVKDLQRAGMEIGGHTVTHPILARTSPERAKKEMLDGKIALERILDEEITLFAYPNGKIGEDYEKLHCQIAKEIGFKGAVTTNPGSATSLSNPYEIPRFTPWQRRRLRFLLSAARNLLN